MPNLVNRLVSEEYQQSFQQAEGLLIVSLAGLSVEESEGLRSALDDAGARLRMVRNSLARRVLAEGGYEVGEDVFAGNVAIAFGSAEAAIQAAKVFTTPELKKAGKVQVRAGVLESRLLDAADAAALAGVPDKDTLRSKIIGCIQGPLRGLASVLQGNQGALARVLQAHADKQEG
jgi:large subunit ribosomal protein L10